MFRSYELVYISLHIPLQYWNPNEGPLLSFVDFFNYSSLQKDSLVSFSKFSFFKMNYKTMTANNTYQKSTQNVLFLNRKSHWKWLVRFKHFIDLQQKQSFCIDIWQKWHPFLFAFIHHVLKLVNTFKWKPSNKICLNFWNKFWIYWFGWARDPVVNVGLRVMQVSSPYLTYNLWGLHVRLTSHEHYQQFFKNYLTFTIF
jgi:hypothetical protein